MRYDKKLNNNSETPPKPPKVKRPVQAHSLAPAKVPPTQRQKQIQANVKRHRKRHKKNYILYYLLMLFAISAVGISLSLTVFFNIETITVFGNDKISGGDIIATSGVSTGENLFRISMDDVAKKIVDSHVIIDSANVSRKFPNTLSIKVKMAYTKVNLRCNDIYYSISNANKVINVGDTPLSTTAIEFVDKNFKEVKVGSYLSSEKDDDIKIMDAALAAIKENKLEEIKVIDITDKLDIKLYYGEKYMIKAGDAVDLNYKLHCAKSIIDTKLKDDDEKGVIDVSINNGMYYFRPAEKIEIP